MCFWIIVSMLLLLIICCRMYWSNSVARGSSELCLLSFELERRIESFGKFFNTFDALLLFESSIAFKMFASPPSLHLSLCGLCWCSRLSLEPAALSMRTDSILFLRSSSLICALDQLDWLGLPESWDFMRESRSRSSSADLNTCFSCSGMLLKALPIDVSNH